MFYTILMYELSSSEILDDLPLLLQKKLSSVAHIVHISFGDGHGLHSQHEPDGSIVMVLFLLFFGILLNFFCRSKGKSSSISDEDSSYIKIV